MIDKNLLRLLGDNKKYIFYTVGLMVLGLFCQRRHYRRNLLGDKPCHSLR